MRLKWYARVTVAVSIAFLAIFFYSLVHFWFSSLIDFVLFIATFSLVNVMFYLDKLCDKKEAEQKRQN